MSDKSRGAPSEDPRALITLFLELSIAYPEVILTQGDNSWPINTLLMQARRDRRGPARESLEAPLYDIVRDAKGKVSIQNLKSGTIAFSEVGSLVSAPKPI